MEMDVVDAWDVLEFGTWDFGGSDSATENGSIYPSAPKRLLSVRPDGKKNKSNKALSQHQLQELLDRSVDLRRIDGLNIKHDQSRDHTSHEMPAAPGSGDSAAGTANPRGRDGTRRDKKRNSHSALLSEDLQVLAGDEPVATGFAVKQKQRSVTDATAVSGAAPVAATDREPKPFAKKLKKESRASAAAEPKVEGAATSRKGAVVAPDGPGPRQKQTRKQEAEHQQHQQQDDKLQRQELTQKIKKHDQQAQQRQQQQQQEQQQGQQVRGGREAGGAHSSGGTGVQDGPATGSSQRAAKRPRMQGHHDKQPPGRPPVAEAGVAPAPQTRLHEGVPKRQPQKQVEEERLPPPQQHRQQQQAKATVSNVRLARRRDGTAEAEEGGDGAPAGAEGDGPAAQGPVGGGSRAEAPAACEAQERGAKSGKQEPGRKRPDAGADAEVQAEEAEDEQLRKPQHAQAPQQQLKQLKGRQQPRAEQQKQKQQRPVGPRKDSELGVLNGGAANESAGKAGRKAAGKEAKAELGTEAVLAPEAPVAGSSLAAAFGGRAAVAVSAGAAPSQAGPFKAIPAAAPAAATAALTAAPTQKLTHAGALAALQKRNAATAAATAAAAAAVSQPDDDKDDEGAAAAAQRGPLGAAGKKAAARGAVCFLDKMRARLAGGRFRYLNEELYTRSGDEAFAMMKSQPELFKQYHDGFQRQTRGWPKQPVDVAIAWLRAKRLEVKEVADFGCGDAKIAASVPQNVHSFDLVASAPGVIACNMSAVPMPDASVDAAIFSLALMGTDYGSFLEEAVRVLKPKGWLWIAEVRSRFTSGGGDGEPDGSDDEGGAGGGGGGGGEEDFGPFLYCLKRLGLRLVSEDVGNRMFVVWVLRKGDGDGAAGKQQQRRGKRGGSGLPWPELKACVYKKR